MSNQPCEHEWRWVDERDVWYCPLCKRIERDDPGEDAA